MTIPSNFFTAFDAVCGWVGQVLAQITNNWLLSMSVLLAIIAFVIDNILNGRDGSNNN